MKSKKQKEYAKYLKSKHWLELRDKILERDNYKCILCGNKDVQVHHKTYDRIGEESFNDLITLCGNCHLTYHSTKYYYMVIPDEYSCEDNLLHLDSDTFNKIKYAISLIRK